LPPEQYAPADPFGETGEKRARNFVTDHEVSRVSDVALAPLRCSHGGRGVRERGARSKATGAGAPHWLPPSSCSLRAPCGVLVTDPVSCDKQADAFGGRRGPHCRQWRAVARPQSGTEGQKGGRAINWGRGLHTPGDDGGPRRDPPQPEGAQPYPLIRMQPGHDPCGGLTVMLPYHRRIRRPRVCAPAACSPAGGGTAR
jgi:hypothetical protein